MNIMAYDLSRIGPLDFQKLAQALIAAEGGPGVWVAGSGSDGGRDATCNEYMSETPDGAPMRLPGYTVFQIKCKETPSDDHQVNGAWLRELLKKELDDFLDPAKKRKSPVNFVVVANVALTPRPENGTWDRLTALIEAYRPKFPPGSFVRTLVWDVHGVAARLAKHPEIAATFSDLVTPAAVVCEAVATQRIIQDAVRSQVEGALRAEGLTHVKQWFANWPANDRLPQPPPPRLTEFSYRAYVERDVEGELVDLLGRGLAVGVTGLVGMGGIGKTQTAMKLACDFHDRGYAVAWLGLLRMNEEQALDALAAAFDLRFVDGLTADAKAAALTDLLHRHRAARSELLLVLDNAERFRGLPSLLEICRGFPVLVTSRTREAEGLVCYRSLDQMSEAQARELCRRFLDGRIATPYDRLKAEELAALDEVCRDLSGHPLGIRLALSGLLPLLKKAIRRPGEVAAHWAEVRRRPIAALCAADGAGDAAEQALHRSVRNTFDWLFKDLPEMDPQAGPSAQLLLPLAAQLAFAPVAFGDLKIAVTALIEVVERAADQDAPPVWLPALRACADEDRFVAAINLLHDTALLTAEDQETEDGPAPVVVMHPLVREYALHDREQARLAARGVDLAPDGAPDGAPHATLDDAVLTANGPSDQAILQATIRSLKQMRGRGGVLAGLAGRAITARQAAEALGAVDAQFSDYYFRARDWGRAERLLEAFAAATVAAGEDFAAGYLLVRLGDLRLRMENAAGMADLAAGLAHLGRCDTPQARKWAAWGRYFVADNRERPRTAAEARVAAAELRRLTSDAEIDTFSAVVAGTERLMRWFADDAALARAQGLHALRSVFSNNLVLDLVDLLADDAPEPAVLARVDAVFAAAIARHAAAATELEQLSPEVEIAFYGARLATDAAAGRCDAASLELAFDRLAAQARAAGLRGFMVEASRREALWLSALRDGDFAAAVVHAERRLAAVAEISRHAPYTATAQPQAALLLSRALAADGDELAAVGCALDGLAGRAREYADNRVVGWLQLARAVVAARCGGAEEAAALTAQARAAFRRFGDVPEIAERVQHRIVALIDVERPRFEAARERLSPVRLTPPDYQPWNLARVRPLPPRAVSAADGRTMRLVEGGWAPGPWRGQEAQDIWLYPFYIDEAPLTAADLRRVGLESLIPADHPADEDPVRLPLAAAREAAARVGKHLPTCAEWTAMTYRHHTDAPAAPGTERAAARQAALARIERAMAGDVSPQLTWPGAAEEDFPPPPPPPNPGEEAAWFEYWQGKQWIDDHGEASALFELFKRRILLNPFIGLDGDERAKLSWGVLNSLSLSTGEKVKVYQSLATIFNYQAVELIKTFEDEYREFSLLMATEQPIIYQYVNKRNEEIRELARFIGGGFLDNSTSSYHAHGYHGVHIDPAGSDETSGLAAAATPVLDADGRVGLTPLAPPRFENLVNAPSKLRLYIRLVKPLFVAPDMDDMAPLSSQNS